VNGDPSAPRAPRAHREAAEPAASPFTEPRTGPRGRPTLNSAVRRRRADRAFFLRLAGAIRQNERALDRLKR
jgi:hypothetical protein